MLALLLIVGVVRLSTALNFFVYIPAAPLPRFLSGGPSEYRRNAYHNLIRLGGTILRITREKPE